MAGFGLGNYINPAFGGFIDQRRNALAGLGAGLLQGRPGAGVQEGIQADTAFAVMQKAEDERARNLNQTVEWARKTYPDQLANVPDNLVGDMAVNLWKQQFMPSDAGSSLPANIREWEYYSSLTPEQQGEYIRMKRANPYLDLGTGFGQPDPINPGSLAGPVIPKNGDIPTGFEQNPAGGGITPMPGGPQAVERNMDLLKATERAKAVDSRSDIVINAIDKATGQSTWATTGPIGSAGRFFGVTPAVDLEGTINTIKANIGFNELQAMREASPTGGALGQVAVQELEMLQSVIASLDPRQGEAQLDENLKTIKTLLERQKMFRQQALEERSAVIGGGAPAGGGTTYTYNPATGNLE